MANQGPDRRAMLEMLARVAVVAQFPGFSRWGFAAQHEHEHSETAKTKPAKYEPQFFAPAEFRMVDQLSELIIPRDDMPGARDAGVVEFIDFMVAHDAEIQFQFRRGLGLVDARAFEMFGQEFLALTEANQVALLSKLVGEEPRFFKLMRTYTVMGYYTSRAGLEALDYPGLKFYTASPECPHKDDPEHRHLPPPRY